MPNSAQFSDSTFNLSSWRIEIIKGGNGGTVNVRQSKVSGGGDTFREITNTVYRRTKGVNSDVLGLHWKVGATYNPQVQGAIQKIHYSENAILIRGFGEGQAAGLALRQNQRVYIPARRLITPESKWTRKELRNLQAQDFVAIGTARQHPDFSARGAPIQFGFFRANTTTNSQYSITGGIDNWLVSINPPASTRTMIEASPVLTGAATEPFSWLALVGVGLGTILLVTLWKQP